MAEETNEQKEVVVNYVNRDEVILSPSLSNRERIGRMARLCYRVELTGDKEKDDATTDRIIKKCIADGHTSVLEHGGISVVFPTCETMDNRHMFTKMLGRPAGKMNIPTPLSVWNGTATESQHKFSTKYRDEEIFQKHKARLGLEIKEEDHQPAPCILADIRAWRDIINERIQVSLDRDTPMMYIVTLKVMYELYKCAPVFFEDLVKKFDEDFMPTVDLIHLDLENNICRLIYNHVPANVIEKDEDGNPIVVEPLTLKRIVEYFFDADEIYAEQSDKASMLSVILTTERALTHQLVRHRREVGYSQESQRYVNYDKKGFSAITPNVDPNTVPAEWIKDREYGTLKEDSPAYKVMDRSLRNSFKDYCELEALGLKSEDARKVLENQCATTIGVTWLRGIGFGNLAYWRVDKHAQFDIRATICRIIRACVQTDHPFFSRFPTQLIISWLNQMKEAKLFDNNAPIDREISRQTERQKKIDEFIENQRKAIIEAARREEEAHKKAIEEKHRAEMAAQAVKDATPLEKPDAPAADADAAPEACDAPDK